MSEVKFINGLMAKAPHERAPDFVKCKLSIKREELIQTLSNMEGDWINADVKVSRDGSKWYVAIDDWKPNGNQQATQSNAAPQAGSYSDDVPF